MGYATNRAPPAQPFFWGHRRMKRRPAPRRVNRRTVELLEERRLLSANNETIATATPLTVTPGTPTNKSSSLDTLGDIDIYQVDLSVGESVSVNLHTASVGSSLYGALRIFDASGNQIASFFDLPANFGIPNSDISVPFTAPISGAYYIGISDSGDLTYDPNNTPSFSGDLSTGAYDLEVNVTLPQPAGNDTIATATPVSYVRDVQTSRSGLLADTRDVNLFSLRDLLPGDQISLAVVASVTGSPLDSYLRLFDANGKELAAADNDGSNPDPSINYTVTTAGKYFVGVSGAGNPNYSPLTANHGALNALGNYVLNMTVRSAPSVLNEFEGNDTLLKANVITLGTSVGGNISSVSDSDWFSVTIPADGQLNVRLTPDAGSTLRALLTLYSSDQKPMYSSVGTTGGAVPTILQHLPAGTYFLQVTSLGKQTSGKYHLATSSIDSTAPFAPVAVGPVPGYVAHGDFNGDGFMDLVTSDRFGSDVSVLLGVGDGTFRPAIGYTVHSGPAAVVVGDFTGDNKLDIAVACRDTGEIVILPGFGDGTFDTSSPIVLTAGAGPLGLVAEDFNNDGKLDLATSNAFSGDVTVFLNQGSSTFAAGVAYTVGTQPESLAAGDFNGDGASDLAVANRGSNNISILLGSTSGAFAAGATLNVGDQPSSISAGDINGDGRADLVTANANSDDVSILLATGGGNFAPEQRVDVRLMPPILAAGDFRSAIKLVDVNNDGKLDLIVSNTADANVAVALGSGNGTFARRQLVTVSNHPQDFDAADLNGDGRPDFFTADGNDSTATIRLGLGDGTFQVAPQTNVGSDPEALASGDFNSDGNIDLVTANDGSLSVLMGLGNGMYAEQQAVGDGTAKAVVIGDFNGDGRPDIAAAYQGTNDIAVYLGLGDGTFRAPVRYAVGNLPLSLITADFNGDGKLDLATANFFTNDVTVWYGKGDGTFINSATITVGANPRALASGDFNGDGKTDLAVTNFGDGTVSILLNDGIGNLVALANTVTVGNSPDGIVAGDFNSDGKLDFATANFGSNDVSIALGDGAGSFTVQAPLAAGFGPRSIVAGDLLGDGRLDLAVANNFSNDVSVFLNLGSLGFATQTRNAVGQSPGALTIRDFNGDGRLDLAVTSGTTGSVTSLLNLGQGNFTAGSRFVSAAVATSPLLADYNGDGVVDSLILNGAGQLLLRLGRAGEPGVFDAPLVLNANLPAGSFTTIRIAGYNMIAAIDRFANAISVYWILADGTAFQTQHFASQTDNSVRIVAGDVNGDGAADLVLAGIGSQSIVLWTQKANGTFAVQAPIAYSGDPTDLSLADVNGDGRNDIVAIDQIGGTISLFISATVNGPFTETRFRAGNSLNGYSLNADGYPELLTRDSTSAVAFGDFNHDGLADVAIANRGNNSVDVLLATSGGGLANPISILVGSGPSVVRAADLNGDGKVDLAVLDAANSTVVVLQGDGLGGFTKTATYNAGNEPNGLSLMDINHDGKLDLVVGNPFGDAMTLPGVGDGTFTPFTRIGRRVEIAVGDVTGSGKDSWLVSNETADRLVLQNSAGAAAGFTQDRNTGVVNPGATKMADIDGDGKLDLIVANSGGNNVLVYLGLGNGQFNATPKSFYAGTNPVGLTVGDVNGDGRPDVVVTNQGSNDVSVLLGDAGTILKPGVRLNVGQGPTQTVVGDFNNDGMTDIAVASATANQVWVLPGVGNGFFNDTTPTIFNTGSSPQSLIVGNFDGKLDLVTLNFNSNSLSFYSGFDPNSRVDIAAGGANPISAVSADFNHDGTLDLVVGNNGDGAISVFLGGNAGLVLSETVFEPGLDHPVALALADLGDGGDLRLLCTEEGDELVRVFSKEQLSPDLVTTAIVDASLDVSTTGEGSSISLVSIINTLTSLAVLAAIESVEFATQVDTFGQGGGEPAHFDFAKLAAAISNWFQTAEKWTDEWLAKLEPLTGDKITLADVAPAAAQLAANFLLPNLPGETVYQVAASYFQTDRHIPTGDAPITAPVVDKAIVDMDLGPKTPAERIVNDAVGQPRQASYTPRILPDQASDAVALPVAGATDGAANPLLGGDDAQRAWLRWAAIGAASAAALGGAGYGGYRLARRRLQQAILLGENDAKLN